MLADHAFSPAGGNDGALEKTGVPSHMSCGSMTPQVLWTSSW